MVSNDRFRCHEHPIALPLFIPHKQVLNDQRQNWCHEAIRKYQNGCIAIDYAYAIEITVWSFAHGTSRIYFGMRSLLQAMLASFKRATICNDYAAWFRDRRNDFTHFTLMTSLYGEFFWIAIHGSIWLRKSISFRLHFSFSSNVSWTALYASAVSTWNAKRPFIKIRETVECDAWLSAMIFIAVGTWRILSIPYEKLKNLGGSLGGAIRLR